jgi:hypothetical protein
MSASLGSKDTDWNFRIFAQRTVQIKSKNVDQRKIVADDLNTQIPLTFNVSEDIPIEPVEIEKEYLATFNVYTLRDTEGIDEGYVEFFEVLDVDQSIDDFIKVYWTYPSHIKFILTGIETE